MNFIKRVFDCASQRKLERLQAELSKAQSANEQNEADIVYVAMMADIEMPERDSEEEGDIYEQEI